MPQKIFWTVINYKANTIDLDNLLKETSETGKPLNEWTECI